MGTYNLNMGLPKDADIRKLFEDIDLRLTEYLKRFIHETATHMEKQVIGRYGSSKDEEALDVIDNIKVAMVEADEVPQKKKGKFRPKKKIREMHHAGVFVQSRKRKSDAIDKTTTVLKVLPNKRGMKQSPPEVFILVRFGPWHLDMIPFLPDDKDATLIYTEVGRSKTARIRNKNNSQRSKINASLKKYGKKSMKREDILKNLNAFENTEYWVMRKELGLDGRKLAVWKPAIEFIGKKGYIKIITGDKQLHRTLTDPNFTGYKSMNSGVEYVSEDVANALEGFQDKIR